MFLWDKVWNKVRVGSLSGILQIPIGLPLWLDFGGRGGAHMMLVRRTRTRVTQKKNWDTRVRHTFLARVTRALHGKKVPRRGVLATMPHKAHATG